MAQDTKAPANSLTMDDFVITPVSGAIHPPTAIAPPNPLGLLEGLRGTWRGRGFNQIWRPFHGTQDRFLELNETEEVLQIVEIPGDIPNRGLLQADIELHGLTYLQKINDANVKQNGKPAGIHIEPGIWISIPATTNPLDPPTVARMANIPHGTSLVAQGTASGPINGSPVPFKPASIVPFTIAPPHTQIHFPEENLGIPSTFRTAPTDIPHVTQAMVNNPNVVLTDALAGKHVKSFVVLVISTIPLNPPPSGGGTSNICFLQGTAGGPNAQSAQMDAVFWIEELENGRHLLQYSQTVLLNFNGLSWPHVSVATLEKER
jgi:hypothetical protein